MDHPHLRPVVNFHARLHQELIIDPFILAALTIRPRAVLHCRPHAFLHYSVNTPGRDYRITYEPGVIYYLEGLPPVTHRAIMRFLGVLSHDPYYWRTHHTQMRALHEVWCEYGLDPFAVPGGLPQLRRPYPEPRLGPGAMAFRVIDQKLVYRVEDAARRLHLRGVVPHGWRSREITPAASRSGHRANTVPGAPGPA